MTFTHPPTEPPWVRPGAVESYWAGETVWEALSSPEQALVMARVEVATLSSYVLKEPTADEMAQEVARSLFPDAIENLSTGTLDKNGMLHVNIKVRLPRRENADG